MLSSMIFDLAFYLTMMLAAAMTASAINYLWPFYRRLTADDRYRVESLDGFRGLLATGVLISHLEITRRYVRTGAWANASEGLIAFLGPGAVAFFFMITGFLFWSRAINGRLSARPLLISRFRRVIPLYWFMTILLILAVFSVSEWQTREDPLNLSLSLLRWASGDLFGAPDINAVNTVRINGVTWTLQYEWVFYLTLPLLVVVVKPSRFALLVCVYLAALGGRQTVPSHGSDLSISVVVLIPLRYGRSLLHAPVRDWSRLWQPSLRVVPRPADRGSS